MVLVQAFTTVPSECTLISTHCAELNSRLLYVLEPAKQRETWQPINSAIYSAPAGELLTDITALICKGFLFK